MKRIVLLALSTAAIALLASCSGGAIAEDTPAAKGVSEVVVKDMKFTPRVIEVPVGTTVTWRFEDGDTPHDVKGDDFKSEVMGSGAFRYSFSTPGSFNYRCTLHSQMTGRVIVTS